MEVKIKSEAGSILRIKLPFKTWINSGIDRSDIKIVNGIAEMKTSKGQTITFKNHTMKKFFSIALFATGLITALNVNAQEDKSKRPSPPAKVTQQITGGATISIDYSQPSVKDRTIGKDLEPMDGKVWRTGANEATVFETDKDVMVQGQKLPAGLYTITATSNQTVFSKKLMVN